MESTLLQNFGHTLFKNDLNVLKILIIFYNNYYDTLTFYFFLVRKLSYHDEKYLMDQ